MDKKMSYGLLIVSCTLIKKFVLNCSYILTCGPSNYDSFDSQCNICVNLVPRLLSTLPVPSLGFSTK